MKPLGTIKAFPEKFGITDLDFVETFTLFSASIK